MPEISESRSVPQYQQQGKEEEEDEEEEEEIRQQQQGAKRKQAGDRHVTGDECNTFLLLSTATD